MFFLASVWLFRTLVCLPQTIPKWPQFFWDDPNFFGIHPKWPQKTWNLLGSFGIHPKTSQIFLDWKISSKKIWDVLGFFGIWLGWPQPNPKKSPEIPRILGWSQKFGAKCAGSPHATPVMTTQGTLFVSDPCKTSTNASVLVVKVDYTDTWCISCRSCYVLWSSHNRPIRSMIVHYSIE